MTAARLVEAGVKDVRIVEKGGDFGGTWYWNRYPGAQCDTASMVYMPLLEETGHRPTEKYAHAPEILAHCRRIGEHFGLYENALFHTEVEDLSWDGGRRAGSSAPIAVTSSTAQFIGLGTGPLHVPKLPGIPGIETFAGHSFTPAVDYAYTGGDPLGAPMTKLADKRVGIIGTGATAVQCVPHLARAAKELYVLPAHALFGRCPRQRADRSRLVLLHRHAGLAAALLENFTANQAGGTATEDLVQDGWTDLSRPHPPADPVAAQGAADARGQVGCVRGRRSREDGGDPRPRRRDRPRPATAQNLKAWYRQLCKRPCFHDSYLQAFNLPGVHLIDTDGKGVERRHRAGVVVAGVEYPLDCLIYASGFEVGTEYRRRAGFDLVRPRWRKTLQHWKDGMRTKHGMHVHGFPNAFFVQPTQGANLISNVPHNLTEAAAPSRSRSGMSSTMASARSR